MNNKMNNKMKMKMKIVVGTGWIAGATTYEEWTTKSPASALNQDL